MYNTYIIRATMGYCKTKKLNTYYYVDFTQNYMYIVSHIYIHMYCICKIKRQNEKFGCDKKNRKLRAFFVSFRTEGENCF